MAPVALTGLRDYDRRAIAKAAVRHGPPPRPAPPTLIETDYGSVIAELVDVRDELAPLLAALPRLLAAAEKARGGPRLDEDHATAAADLLRQARRKLAPSIDTGKLTAVAKKYGKLTADHNARELRRQAVDAIGVDIVTADRTIPQLVEHFAAENVSLIRSLGNRNLDEIEKVVTRAFTTGMRAEQISEEIGKRFEISERHARLIARDQIGKLNGQVTAARHKEIGVTSFVWRSVRDARVRPEHRHLDGKTFRYDKLPAEGLPGEPILCRCYQEPVFDDLLGGALPSAPPPRISKGEAFKRKVESDLQGRTRYSRREALLDQHSVGYVVETSPGMFAARSVDRSGTTTIGGSYGSELEASTALMADVQRRVSSAADRIKRYDEKSYRAAVARGDRAEMRAQVRGLLWDAGVLPLDALSPRSSTVNVKAMAEATAVHHWDGSISVRPTVLDLSESKASLYEQLQVLLHEELHGATPYAVPSYYQGTAAAVEEATVDLVARKIAADAVGVPVDWRDGAYQSSIDKIYNIIQQEAGMGGTSTKIAEAGIGMRSRRAAVVSVSTPLDLVDRFVAALKVSVKARARIRARLLTEVTAPF